MAGAASDLALAIVVIAVSAVAPVLARPFADAFPDEGALFGKAKGVASAKGGRADASTLAFLASEGAIPAGMPCSFKPGLIDVPVLMVGAKDAPIEPVSIAVRTRRASSMERSMQVDCDAVMV